MSEAAVTHYLCIGCPIGCRLEVEADGPDVVEVRGFSCKIGKAFAAQEHTAPTRMVATSVHVSNGVWGRLPVKTEGPIPKEKVLELADALHKIELQAPVKMGTVILENALGTGENVVATRDIDAVSA